ncbi:hypothetical protein LEP1GSC133_2330 [Leptospira borgpetersenii serovar Pomona str. 200901868]|uniref:Uncharacterized protein n=4 Tax=Leptospira borgpetersenii TaxID=174 RepID=M3GLP3_LEPBO|nr:hypothetical protein LEP1GSC128_2687 [Leptospira borgpetersenii str. 200801926]EMG01902.1 hypothetical protein LEP1GSC123_0460 [Leptospira borgpetersenii str. 200701203]EMK09185.1 hypothetical protein LEP1GSC066_0667 [Leptospira sp. serovar Kenya str. Sh9]EMN12759.1 hypothetical protein LEP1GSC055_3480 [Leptospira borgpetersenii str. Brem 307]EMN16042.1 hypothetical protein LEP1GSC056_0991 [Leptospira borgpetersenii str. Brem 328]EMO63907.1 hypothetical protein LEP1GSC133_2330 [Leptospira b
MREWDFYLRSSLKTDVFRSQNTSYPNCPPNVGVATEIAVLAVFSYRLKL